MHSFDLPRLGFYLWRCIKGLLYDDNNNINILKKFINRIIVACDKIRNILDFFHCPQQSLETF